MDDPTAALIRQLVPGLDPVTVDLEGIEIDALPGAVADADVQALLDGSGAAGAAARALLTRAGSLYYADPAVWAQLGYRPLPPGARWPEVVQEPPAALPLHRAGEAYDVVIVGAGAGGGVAAHVLTRAGLRVLLVDRGPDATRAELPHDLLRNTRVHTGRQRQLDPPYAANPRVVQGEPVDTRDPGWGGNAFGVGGGTRVYGAQAWRFSPEDFRMGSVYGPTYPDWPIEYEDLEPWYEIVEQQLGVAGHPGPRPHDGRRVTPVPLPPFPLLGIDELLRAGAATLGIDATAVPLLMNSVPFNGRPACIRCGTCVGFACHNESRTGTHNTVISWAAATGRADLVAGAVVERLLTDPQGTVVGVRVTRPGGPTREIRARHVVVAAGAVETARLLLLSGVGDGHDQVGRYLQSHPYSGAVGIFDEVVQKCVGPGPTTSTTQYRHGNPGVMGGGILANEFVPPPVEYWGRMPTFDLFPAWGRAGQEGVARTYRHASWVFGPLQEVPSARSRVQLSAEVTDALGLPVARLSSAGRHEQDRVGLDFLGERAAEWLRASGARTVARSRSGPDGLVSAGQHQAGTARMGTDPANSVTDVRGRVWGHDGVTVADTSLHVTNGGVNPVLTVLALAWKVSEELAAELR